MEASALPFCLRRLWACFWDNWSRQMNEAHEVVQVSWEHLDQHFRKPIILLLTMIQSVMDCPIKCQTISCCLEARLLSYFSEARWEGCPLTLMDILRLTLTSPRTSDNFESTVYARRQITHPWDGRWWCKDSDKFLKSTLPVNLTAMLFIKQWPLSYKCWSWYIRFVATYLWRTVL